MPKARTAKNCYYCEAEDRIKMTFMLCGLCHRHFCSAQSSQDAEKVCQPRSRIARTLNVPRGYASAPRSLRPC